MSLEVKLVQEIEKYPFLYNFTLADYNRKDVIEEAWKEIAKQVRLSVQDCKEKWRNIRSSYLRSTKFSKLKKPYYLTEYIQFVIPFMKPLAPVHRIGDTDNEDNGEEEAVTNNEIALQDIKIEPDIDFENHEPNTSEDQITLEELTADPLTTQKRTIRRKRPFFQKKVLANFKQNKIRRIISYSADDTPDHSTVPGHNSMPSHSTIPDHDTVIDHNAISDHNTISDQNTTIVNHTTTEHNATKLFLLSLLPELETMSGDEIRIFKIKVMMLIDDIKTRFEDVRRNISSVDDQLQKRLIDLLVKNLENKS